MFSFLFGKSKKQEAEAAAAAASVSKTTTISTLNMLQTREADLEKRIQMLEAQSRAAGEAAVAANKAGQKQKALTYIQKRKMYEEQIQTNHAMIMRLMTQRTALETSNLNAETLNAQRTANKVIKAQQQGWNPDTVADLTEETHELMENSREITNLLREPVSSDLPTEADLEAELAMLEPAMLESAVEPALAPPTGIAHPSVAAAAAAPVPVAALPAFPAVPTHTLAAPPRAKTMDAELAALEAM